VSRFHFDNEAQRRVRDLVLGPGLYGPFSLDGRYVYIDKGRLASILQQRYAVDTILQRADGTATCVEEKIVRDEYAALTLETMSCTIPGRESDGWMKYGKADWLNYAMCRDDGNVVCHIIDFRELQNAFWPEATRFGETVTEQNNRTACRIVPLSWINEQGIGHHARIIRPTPEGCAAVKDYRAGHYKHARPVPAVDSTHPSEGRAP
jgi:hypothetical protein